MDEVQPEFSRNPEPLNNRNVPGRELAGRGPASPQLYNDLTSPNQYSRGEAGPRSGNSPTELTTKLKRIDAEPVYLPQRTLLVLCGIPGSGKSTFASRFIAQQGLPSTTIVSSDQCRALISDDEENQQVSRDAFDLFHFIIYKRMLLGRFIIADSTALLANPRHRLLSQALSYQYATCLLVFPVDPAICIQRDRARHRIVGETIIRNLQQLLEQALRDIPGEQWQQVYRVEDNVSPSTLSIRYEDKAFPSQS